MRNIEIETRAAFDAWVGAMDHALAQLFQALPGETAEKLDFTLPSLPVLEAWLLARYDRMEAILVPEEAFFLDGAARYAGETLLEHNEGRWDIELQNSYAAYYRLPVIRTASWIDCPATLVTASLHRRRGDYMLQVATSLNKPQE